jgi:hypothetical protein
MDDRQPERLGRLTVDTMFLSSSSGSMDRTVATGAGWSSIRSSAAFCGGDEMVGKRIALLDMRVTSPRSGVHLGAVAEVEADRRRCPDRQAAWTRSLTDGLVPDDASWT